MNASSGEGNLHELTGEIFASEVFQRYSMRLLRLANDRLGKDVRGKISPEDVVQSAFKSFFRRLKDFRFDRDGTDTIWGLLSIITIRKCRKWDAFYRCDKRAVQRERPSDSSLTGQGKHTSTEPGPEDALVVEELLEKLFREFEPRQHQMILLRIDGCSIEEIASQCQSSCRTVARTIATAKQMLADLLLDGDLPKSKL
ncbi:MAG: sigma-70 family RNA polymerase sigma factor [Pirellulaceae bacterium]|nr:sigma-70 family RNA polymerase sigma factor [Pirellulaceae bacterium]